ncbi:MAG: hypothetical protein LLF76_05390 [Planctomycetaceae bacterium]|nr:hypothetical protein [Planctomycetaceae bacterium]
MHDFEKQFEQIASGLKTDDRPSAEHKDALRQQMLAACQDTSSKPARRIWPVSSKITKSNITKTAAAMIIVAVLTGIYQLTGSMDGASKAYAAAFDSIRQARTFSCREIAEIKREGVGRCILEQEWSFKEPDLERHEYIRGVADQFIGEVTITDYGKRQKLRLNAVAKTAIFFDKIASFDVDPQTGKVRLTQLDTSIREDLLQMRIQAVKDLGEVEVDGRTLRMLQAQKGDRVTTVYVDPQSGLPVEIEIKWLEQERSPVLYTAIRIDEPLDDSLFSLEPPEGYTLERSIYDWPISKKKLSAKMMYLCTVIRTKNGQFPETLEGPESVGVSNEILQVLLSAPDEENGPPVIQYRQPRPGREWGTEVITYEVHDAWPEDGIVVGFADGHCEWVKDQQAFEKLLQ